MLDENAKQFMADLKAEEKAKKKSMISSLVSKVVEETIIETVYRPDELKTLFAVFQDGEVTYKSKVKVGVETFYPIPANLDILQHGVVLFPSEAIAYDTVSRLIDDIKSFIHKYLQVSPFFEDLSSYYVLFSWLFDKFNELPYLRALGDYGSGKSRFLQTIGSICYKPMFVGGASSASPIFRIISQFQGTLVLDEADYRFSDTTQDIVKILNQGFSRGAPVLRSEGNGKKFEVKAYNVFGTKILATRKHFHDNALESRCLVERMERRTRKDIPLNLTADFWNEAQVLRNKLLMFRFKNYFKPIDFEQEIDQSLEPRLNQIIVPLLSIIDDIQTRNRLKDLIKNYNAELLEDQYCSYEADVLRALIIAETEFGEPTMKEIADVFNKGVTAKDEITSRKVGHVVRKILRLKCKRGRDGVRLISGNSDRIEELKAKYGIYDSPGEHVNDVNVTEEGNKQIKEIQKIFNVPDSAIYDT